MDTAVDEVAMREMGFPIGSDLVVLRSDDHDEKMGVIGVGVGGGSGSSQGRWLDMEWMEMGVHGLVCVCRESWGVYSNRPPAVSGGLG